MQDRAEIETLVRSSGLFDPDWYSARYPDVGELGIEPLEHFVRYGLKLQRDPGPQFSCRHYLETYPDIKKNKINPTLHFIKHGRKEGRSGRPQSGLQNGNDLAPDADGNLIRPNRDAGNVRDFLSISRGRRHYWYKDDTTDAFLASIGSAELLPRALRRILVVAHDMKLSTGVSRSISHYLNLMSQAGGVELTSVELGKQATGWTLLNDLDAHDFVIINSLAIFAYHDGVADLLTQRCAGKSAVYLHETGWGFDGFARDFPERYADFARNAPALNFLCVSQAQCDELRARFGVRNARIVYETTTLNTKVSKSEAEVEPISDRAIEIVMAGTIQPRKGATLFSEVADLAAQAGLPWKFRWAGWTANPDVYQSTNVDYVGNLDQEALAVFLQNASVFFLSSEDDPFPLACLEALLAGKRTIVYRKTGVSELLDGVGGAAVYEEHTAEAAFAALRKVLGSRIDLGAYQRMTEMIAPDAFVRRMNEAISGFWRDGGAVERPLARSKAKVAVILHLFYLDLWPEFETYLRNISHLDYRLYITVSKEADPKVLSATTERILRFAPDATILESANRGMDIGPFLVAAEAINRSSLEFDLLLKIHTKKSLAASGLQAGAEWRKHLLEGLMGTPTQVDQILSVFEAHPEIGMVGSRGMLIEKSTSDQAAGGNVNETHMTALADRMELRDRSLSFFRGTMFWVDAKPVLDAVRRAGLTIDEFEHGHQSDNSKAHAMERLFPCIIRSCGREIHQFDQLEPAPLRLLKNRERGKDIYVIAAGASCDFINPEFFEDKCVIAVNRSFVRFPATYVIYKEYAGAGNEQLLLESGAIPVVAKWHAGNIVEGRRRPNTDFFRAPRYYYFDHVENRREKVDLSVIDLEQDKIVVSYSTITSALHLAAYLGARNIIIVGHDCGSIDGRSAFTGYYDSFFISPWKDQDEYQEWLGLIEGQTLAVNERLRSVFECNIVSLNPFINFGLEGHVYSRRLAEADSPSEEPETVE